MRLKITLHHQPHVIVPWDYQYAIQQWIYQTISRADDTLATMLHDQGYTYEGKSFKLFSFGPWHSFPFRAIPNEGIKFKSPNSEIEVSFVLPSVLSSFVSGLFQDQQHSFYYKGGIIIPITTQKIEILHEPLFIDGPQTYSIKTGARISIKVEGIDNPQYIGPDHPEYHQRFVANLIHKHNASLENKSTNIAASDITMTVISDYKTQKINVHKDGHHIEMIGYKYDLTLSAPASVHRTLYYGGAGEECSMGMGWVEVLKE